MLNLDGLIGTNPAGLFASLGALDIATRLLPDRDVRLWWEGTIQPRAVLRGPDSVEHLIELILADADRWKDSVVLLGRDGSEPGDIKPDPADVRPWFEAAAASEFPEDLRLLSALLSEGALAGKGDSKPSHLHFTSGQQKFLRYVRQLRYELDEASLDEALAGPWQRDSKLPVLRWDNERGERLHALSSKSPSLTKVKGVPGADWLAFIGLTFFPAITTGPTLLTTACKPEWKVGGELHWCTWNQELSDGAVRVLLGLSRAQQTRRVGHGVSDLFVAEIRRSDPGGYGSFGPTNRRF